MKPYRKIMEDMPETLEIPPELRHRRVEVSLYPQDAAAPDEEREREKSREFARKYAGMFEGDPITRQPQGTLLGNFYG